MRGFYHKSRSLFRFSRSTQANKNALGAARLERRPIGIEPTTNRLGRGDSASELRAHGIIIVVGSVNVNEDGQKQMIHLLQFVQKTRRNDRRE